MVRSFRVTRAGDINAIVEDAARQLADAGLERTRVRTVRDAARNTYVVDIHRQSFVSLSQLPGTTVRVERVSDGVVFTGSIDKGGLVNCAALGRRFRLQRVKRGREVGYTVNCTAVCRVAGAVDLTGAERYRVTAVLNSHIAVLRAGVDGEFNPRGFNPDRNANANYNCVVYNPAVHGWPIGLAFYINGRRIDQPNSRLVRCAATRADGSVEEVELYLYDVGSRKTPPRMPDAVYNALKKKLGTGVRAGVLSGLPSTPPEFAVQGATIRRLTGNHIYAPYPDLTAVFWPVAPAAAAAVASASTATGEQLGGVGALAAASTATAATASTADPPPMRVDVSVTSLERSIADVPPPKKTVIAATATTVAGGAGAPPTPPSPLDGWLAAAVAATATTSDGGARQDEQAVAAAATATATESTAHAPPMRDAQAQKRVYSQSDAPRTLLDWLARGSPGADEEGGGAAAVAATTADGGGGAQHDEQAVAAAATATATESTAHAPQKRVYSQSDGPRTLLADEEGGGADAQRAQPNKKAKTPKTGPLDAFFQMKRK